MGISCHLELEKMGYKIIDHGFIPKSRGGGYQVRFISPRGNQGVFHSEHIDDTVKTFTQKIPDIHFSPHYHFYPSVGDKMTLVPGADIPWWF